MRFLRGNCDFWERGSINRISMDVLDNYQLTSIIDRCSDVLSWQCACQSDIEQAVLPRIVSNGGDRPLSMHCSRVRLNSEYACIGKLAKATAFKEWDRVRAVREDRYIEGAPWTFPRCRELSEKFMLLRWMSTISFTLQSYVQRKYRQIIVYLSKQPVIVDKQTEIVNKSERERGSKQTNGEYKQTNEA